jgi:hypothetical protein
MYSMLISGIILCFFIPQITYSFTTASYSLIGFFLFFISSLNIWKKNSFACDFSDPEQHFNIYLSDIEGRWATEHLRSAASAGQPEALVILGAMIYSGEKYAENKDLGAINLASQCRAKINELFDAGRVTKDQRVDLLEIVRSGEPLHLVNILAILNKDAELDKLAKNAARIKGWDAENLVFFVEE